MKRLAAFTAAIGALAVAWGAHAGGVPEPLSAADAKFYSQAFEAAEKGDFDKAEAALGKVKDATLSGRLAYLRLMHPRTAATWSDLSGWLNAHADEAGAERIHALAVRRKPKKAARPKAPTFAAALEADDAAKTPRAANRAQAAREAYYAGDVQRALTLAAAAGERWIAGLSAFRLGRPDEAFGFFSAVASDAGQDDWLRSAGAFWAARSATSAGLPDARDYLRLAASTPHTFYGMIAERQLAMVDGQLRLTAAVDDAAGDPIAALISKAVNAEPAKPLFPTELRARRAEALFQIGRKDEALAEAKIGLALARTDKARDAWRALMAAFDPEAAAPPVRLAPAVPRAIPAVVVRQSPPAALPAPDLAPKGGFTIDRAMVYALVRQESAFNPQAQSGAGAVGLMQLMPEAAARAAGDDKLKADMSPLFDPAFNLRVGQDYFTWLMERGLAPDAGGGYDVLRTVAAYNGGPGVLLRTAAQLGQDCDSLLLIESLPAQETRNYVERVMASYWQYRRMFGDETPTLDALAQGQRVADFRLDGGLLASSISHTLSVAQAF